MSLKRFETLALLHLVDEAITLEAAGFESILGDFVTDTKDEAIEELHQRGVLTHSGASGVPSDDEVLTFEDAVAEAIGIETERQRNENTAEVISYIGVSRRLDSKIEQLVDSLS